MSVAGFNLEISSQQFAPNSAGGSIEIASDQFVPNAIGAGFDDLIDLVISVETLGGVQILDPTYTVTNSINNDSVNSLEVLTLSVNQSDTLDVSASAPGYSDNSLSISFTLGTPQRLVIQLQEIPKINFTCTTIFKSADGVTVEKPLSNGYIEVTFTGDNTYDKTNYTPYFEALPLGGSKYNSTVLGYEVLSQTVSSIVYKVDVITEGGEFCYLSNYIKNQC